MTEEQPRKRKRAGSEVLTYKQFFICATIGVLVVMTMAVLYLRDFPVDRTILPMVVGFIFIGGMYFTIKTGVLKLKGGGRMLRREEPVAFWFFVSVFIAGGILSIVIGMTELLKFVGQH